MSQQMRPGAGDDHPHDVVVKLVALPGRPVVGQESAKQAGEHPETIRVVGSLISVEHHLHLFRARPKIRLAAFGVFRVPGATVFHPVKGFGVSLKQRVCIRRRECPGSQREAKQRDEGGPKAPG